MITKIQPSKSASIIPIETIERRIFLIRGKKVMLDADLAELYEVSTMRLNEQVKRNAARFPGDFMFRLSIEETKTLNLSQFAIGSQKHRDPKFTPFAFTEHGVTMLSAVLRSQRAVEVSVFVVRAFIKLREMLATHKDLAAKMEALEREQMSQGQQLAKVCRIIKNLLEEPMLEPKPIGFKRE